MTIMTLWMPILVSAIVSFMAGSVIWMFMPWHKTDWSKIPDEEAVRGALKGTAGVHYRRSYGVAEDGPQARDDVWLQRARLAGLMRIAVVSILSILLVALAVQAEDATTDPGNTVVLQLDDGPIVIELNPRFAPATSAQFKRLVRDGFYDGLSFYRVIDGFVAQAGDGSDMAEDPNAEPSIKAEFDLDGSDDLPFVVVQAPDLFAPETGFVDGFPAARDLDADKIWLTHCPGAVGMARNDDPDSGSTDFYIVIGQAPRYLDRNITVFGRVVFGMDVAQRILRGPPEEGGMIDDATESTLIRSAQLMSDLPADERLTVAVADTSSQEFESMLDGRRQRTAEWFISTPPAALDVCQVPNQGHLQR